MTDTTLLHVTEPRLDSVKHGGFHAFRFVLIVGYGIWLTLFSNSNSDIVRGLITLALLVVLAISWHLAKRWSQATIVLELTPTYLGYSLSPRQRFKRVSLADVTQLKFHRHLLILENQTGIITQLHFPLKHRQLLPKLLNLLKELYPNLPQIAI